MSHAMCYEAPTSRSKGHGLPACSWWPRWIRHVGGAFAGLLLVGLALVPALASDNQLQFADLGDCKLSSGEVIQDCRLGYRTFGTLNAEKSNAVLFPTWFSGASSDLAQFVGPDKYLDPARFFVVAVDALGNGVSSSPSNSKKQPGASFPQFSILDMVRSQHRLLTEVLGIDHLHAVMGLSMGGMQTFQWITAYPEFTERAIPIIGSPRLAPYDLLLWGTELNAIEQAYKAYDDPRKARAAAMSLVSNIQDLALSSPGHFNAENTRDKLAGTLAGKQTALVDSMDPFDWASQLRAMMGLDVAVGFGGSLDQAASAVKAKVLVIAATQDHMVTPEPALAFAKRLKAKTVLMEGNCGHMAFGCEAEKVRSAVKDFLEK